MFSEAKSRPRIKRDVKSDARGPWGPRGAQGPTGSAAMLRTSIIIPRYCEAILSLKKQILEYRYLKIPDPHLRKSASPFSTKRAT